jgi:hypothetical protein
LEAIGFFPIHIVEDLCGKTRKKNNSFGGLARIMGSSAAAFNVKIQLSSGLDPREEKDISSPDWQGKPLSFIAPQAR